MAELRMVDKEVSLTECCETVPVTDFQHATRVLSQELLSTSSQEWAEDFLREWADHADKEYCHVERPNGQFGWFYAEYLA